VASYAELMEANAKLAQRIMDLDRDNKARHAVIEEAYTALVKAGVGDVAGRDLAHAIGALAKERDEAIRNAHIAARATLRDTFAAAALTGLLASVPSALHTIAVLNAYKLADAMLAERARKP
jgi:hypothetical protein